MSPKAQAQSLQPLAEVEREHILRALRELDGNVAAAALRLGISRKKLYRRMAAYGVPVAVCPRRAAR